MKAKCLFRWGDMIPVAVCLVLVALLLTIGTTGHAGDHVRVQTPTGEYRLSLDEDVEQVFVGRDGLSVTVAVCGGRVRVTNADCDDHICVNTGQLGGAVRTIACVPAGIVIAMTDVDSEMPDAVAR